jgi:A/G-specific adenine glycosylase
MTSTQKKRLLAARDGLLAWHDSHARRYAWRKKVRKPYTVFLCEMMGQQTQATRIAEYLSKFLKAFPTPNDLASAKVSQVIKLWQGLGYNRRAINLHRAANMIVNDYNGKFPKTYGELITLPGVGPYSANAILVFAFEQPVSAIDINVSRVLTRLSRKSRHEDLLPKEPVEAISNEILPIARVRSWHEAIMDLGATICTKRNPKCSVCPITEYCPSNTLESEARKNIPINRGVETQYFGHPKRIWRGRILRHISSNSKTTKKELRSYLASEFGITTTNASSLLKRVLPELQHEGFIKIINESLTLA